MTRQEIEIEVRMTARKISRERGIPPDVAYRMAYRAACRARGTPAGMGISEVKSNLVMNVIPNKPVAIADTPSGAPAILANVAAAGDDPSVVAARNAVSKWSFLIPIGGLIMSAKNKISAWRSPVSAAMVGSRRR